MTTTKRWNARDARVLNQRIAVGVRGAFGMTKHRSDEDWQAIVDVLRAHVAILEAWVGPTKAADLRKKAGITRGGVGDPGEPENG